MFNDVIIQTVFNLSTTVICFWRLNVCQEQSGLQSRNESNCKRLVV